ncbi:IS66 family transposase [Singulisphaera sp. Ch08]|uniref:IS66 family transposase n=1 Tax=Singulisphaera sp. Ch08 TaxID=3120278 RepID=A0AAU7CLK4_9BACT
MPSDPAFLQQMIIELLAALRETRRQNEELQHRLDLLLRRLYGPRTERFDPNQPLLIPDAFEPLAPEPEPSVTGDAVAPEPEPEPGAAPAKKNRSHGRRPLPKNLRREPRVYELTEAERRCPQCGETRAQISAERSEQLDYVPATLFVVEHALHLRLPALRRSSRHRRQASPADPQGFAWTGTTSSCDHGKYADHIPLHRQERRLARQGWSCHAQPSATGWPAPPKSRAALRPDEDIGPVVRHDSHRRHVGEAADSERKIKALARLWIYFGDHLYPYNVLISRGAISETVRVCFSGFRGYLQADAFSGYDGIYAGGNVVEVGCNAHARRKFVEAQKTDLTRASTALAYYRQLYAIEKQIKAELAKLPEDANEPTRAAIRLRVRQERAVPVWESLEKWLKEERPQVLPKSPMGGAIGYMKNHWEALKRYTSSGYLSIDNNVAEQHMKTIATGRKNWLFTGSETGGKTMAVLFSVVSSCQRHGHDPFVYLRDVLSRLPVLPKENLADLLPDRWSPPQAADPAATPEGPIADGSPS